MLNPLRLLVLIIGGIDKMARIMIVDDTNFMRMTLAAILEKDDHHIVGMAQDGKEAIKLYQETKPDIVTMNITMPIMNGIEATKEIIKVDSEAKIVMCSAMGQ